MTAIDVFHFDDDRDDFEAYSHANGHDFWYARDLMEFLGYASYSSFVNVINRAIGTCMTLKIDVVQNFKQVERVIDGKKKADYKLSKFACYLVSMNGDTKKEQVAKAQIYFVTIAETLSDYLKEHENIERLLVRDDISEREKSISGVVNRRGVTNYAFFQNAGYRGMYNKNLNTLKQYKGLRTLQRSLLDFMGKEELAANLFRLTQTESKIKNENIQGQRMLENTAETVGKQVRKAMYEISGTRPEDLPLTDDLKTVTKELKKTHKKLLGDGK